MNRLQAAAEWLKISETSAEMEGGEREMDNLREQIEEIAGKYAECVRRMLDAELKKKELTVEEISIIGSGFSLLNHAMATIERISRLQKADG